MVPTSTRVLSSRITETLRGKIICVVAFSTLIMSVVVTLISFIHYRNASIQEQLEMALESIEKRSKYLDEPNVISDEAVDNIVSQINFFDETND